MDLTSAAVQEDTYTVTQSINPAGGRLRPYEATGNGKRICGREPGVNESV